MQLLKTLFVFGMIGMMDSKPTESNSTIYVYPQTTTAGPNVFVVYAKTLTTTETETEATTTEFEGSSTTESIDAETTTIENEEPIMDSINRLFEISKQRYLKRFGTMKHLEASTPTVIHRNKIVDDSKDDLFAAESEMKSFVVPAPKGDVEMIRFTLNDAVIPGASKKTYSTTDKINWDDYSKNKRKAWKNQLKGATYPKKYYYDQMFQSKNGGSIEPLSGHTSMWSGFMRSGQAVMRPMDHTKNFQGLPIVGVIPKPFPANLRRSN